MSRARRSPRFTGRRTPYTVRGIARLRCCRCRRKAVHQWNACANGNRWVPICAACDIAVNRLVLRFLRIPNADALLAAYAAREMGGPVGRTP